MVIFFFIFFPQATLAEYTKAPMYCWVRFPIAYNRLVYIKGCAINCAPFLC